MQSTELNFRESLDRAEVLMKHKEQLHDIWGVGGGRKPVRFLSKEMMTVLKVVSLFYTSMIQLT